MPLPKKVRIPVGEAISLPFVPYHLRIVAEGYHPPLRNEFHTSLMKPKYFSVNTHCHKSTILFTYLFIYCQLKGGAKYDIIIAIEHRERSCSQSNCLRQMPLMKIMRF